MRIVKQNSIINYTIYPSVYFARELNAYCEKTYPDVPNALIFWFNLSFVLVSLKTTLCKPLSPAFFHLYSADPFKSKKKIGQN